MCVCVLDIHGDLPAFGIRFFFDGHDIGVYYKSSRWVVQEGTLYRDVVSEYPPLANLVFATVRWLSETLLGGGYSAFAYVWVAAAGGLYALATLRVAATAPLIVLAAWLAPAPIYFALLRFDVYPVAATLFALLAIKRNSYTAGAFWLGIAIALKGYALFALPAYLVFIWQRQGLAAAMRLAIVAVLPMLMSLAAVYAYAGWDGMLAPFRFHGVRGFNGESSYDAVNHLLGIGLTAKDVGYFPIACQIGCALVAAAMRPRSFEDLSRAMGFAVLAFVTFSGFYSPQFVLWILPFIAFVGSPALGILAFVFAVATYVYFPLAYDLAWQSDTKPFLAAMVVVVAGLRAVMLFVLIPRRSRDSAGQGGSAGAHG